MTCSTFLWRRALIVSAPTSQVNVVSPITLPLQFKSGRVVESTAADPSFSAGEKQVNGLLPLLQCRNELRPFFIVLAAFDGECTFPYQQKTRCELHRVFCTSSSPLDEVEIKERLSLFLIPFCEQDALRRCPSPPADGGASLTGLSFLSQVLFSHSEERCHGFSLPPTSSFRA